MSRFTKMLLIAGAMGTLAAAANAQNRIRMDDPNANGLGGPVDWRQDGFPGGAFRGTTIQGNVGVAGGPGGTGNSFLTFCMENGFELSFNTTYYAEIATSSVAGGTGGGNPDPLDSATALLYSTFRNGGNFGGLATIDTPEETRSLQLAIWVIEQEIPGFQGDTLAMNLRNWAVANNNGSLYGVRVLRLWQNADLTGDVQDVLTVIVPLPPAAWAGIGSLAAVAGVGYVRRRRQLA